MKQEKSIISLTEEETEEIRQVHHIKMGLIEMIGIADRRKEKFLSRIAKKYKLDVGLISIDVEKGKIVKR